MSSYEYLFKPIRIGSMEVPNRIFMSPHGMLSLGCGTDEQAGYFEARAKGGAGIMGIAACLVTPVTSIYPGMMMRVYDREDIPKIAKVCNAVHKHGAKIFVQGIWATGAPGVPQPSREIPHTLWGDNQSRSMTKDEIHELVKASGVAAVNAREAGADGIEFPMAGGAGLQCFSSPLYNKRTDEYGGSLENRLRVIFEIIDEVKARCGRDFNLGFNPNVDESIMGGPGLEVGVQLCKLLAGTGKVDWLRVTARGQKPQMTQFHYPSSYLPQGTYLYASAAVREEVDNIPIVSGGRITSPEFAEQALAEGQCDMVLVARAFIADPEWPNKARKGETEEIRACIGDVEGCFLRSCKAQRMGCTVNPDIGLEHKSPGMASVRKKVVIAGGGVAGMEAALVASQRGHNVTLLEQSDVFGGHVYLESQLPGLGDRSDIIRWLSLQLEKQKVDIRLNTKATPENIMALRPDVVIVATGSIYSHSGITQNQLNPIPGADVDYVLTPEDVILGKKDVGQSVLIYDTTGYEVGPGLAEMLADQGKEVTVVSIESGLAASVKELGINQLVSMRILSKAKFVPDCAITSIDNHTVSLMNVLTYQPDEIRDIDTVILVASKPPVDELYHSLVGKIPNLHIIGDARESHYNVFGIDEAIKDGWRTGMSL